MTDKAVEIAYKALVKDLITSTEVIKFMRGEPIAKPNGQLSLLEQPHE